MGAKAAKAQGFRPAMLATMRAMLKLLIAGCFGLMAFYVWGWITDAFEERLAVIYDNWGITYPYSGSLDVKSMDASDLLVVTFLWLPLLLAAYATFLLHVIPQGAVPNMFKALRRRVGRVMAWEVPPRRLWTWWCGGMSVKDALVLGFAIGLNVFYFVHYFSLYKKRVDAVVNVGLATPEPASLILTERAALTFGIMMWPCIWLLFLPIPQSSFLQWLTGVSYTEMIRYHRWFGHITMVVLSLHAWLYYIYWAGTHQFWVNFSDWSTIRNINHLAGSLAYFFGLVLWATSIHWARRRFFEVFFRCHIICFLGFMFFAYIHYNWSWSYFLPGLLLYGVDLVLRAGQLSNTTLITAAHVDEQAGLATIQLKTSKACGGCPIHELFLLVPSISRWQWHPFSVAGTKTNPTGGATLTLNTKRYGKWTKALLERLQCPQPLAVRVSAPEGAPGHQDWEGCQSVLMVAGGIGATPLLAMLRDMAASNKAKAALPHVRFVWASRHPGEFCLLDADLLEAAKWADHSTDLAVCTLKSCESLHNSQDTAQCNSRFTLPSLMCSSPEGWLTIELYSTKPLPINDKGSESGLDSPRDSVGELKSDDSAASLDGKLGKQASLGSASQDLTPAACARTLSSPFFHKLATAIQPPHAGWLHLALIYLLVWLGAFLGTYLGAAYFAEAATYYESIDANRPRSVAWKVGMITFFTQIVLGLGMPYILAVLPVHVWRYRRATRQPQSGDVLTLAAPDHPTGHGAGSELVGNRITCSGESSLEIQSGRPALRDAMLAAAKGLAAGDTVGVFVGGPEPLTRQVQLDVAALNSGCRQGPYFSFRAVAHFL